MEPLSVGLGLAGLAPLFKVCTQLFDLIDKSHNQGVDREILATRLDIERVRLCLWGQAVGLVTGDQNVLETNFQQHLDSRLEDRRIAGAISDVLVCMRRIFEDTDALVDRYGLQKTVTAGAPASEGRVRDTRTALRTTFRRTLERFNVASSNSQRNLGVKASTKWVIIDKKRFELLLEDLRDFNDGLSTLLPDIDDQARQDIATEISQSVDVDDLELVEQAATAASHHDLAEVASTRLTQLTSFSHHDDDAETTLTDPKRHGDVDVKKLTKELALLQRRTRMRNRGMLNVSIEEICGKYFARVQWDDIGNDDLYAAKEVQSEFVKVPFIAWGLQFAAERTKSDGATVSPFADFVPEAGRKSVGKYPGTNSVHGYAAEFQWWADHNTPKPLRAYPVAVHQPPPVTLRQLLDRTAVLRGLHRFPAVWTDERKRRDVQFWAGDPATIQDNPHYGATNHQQIEMLLNMLNQDGCIDDLKLQACMADYLFGAAGHGALNFFYQMILAQELRFRLKLEDTWFAGMTIKVIFALELVDRWMDSVAVTYAPDTDSLSDTDEIRYESLVHGRQIEGLIRFAEEMKWPKLFEMRQFAEGAYVNHHSSSSFSMPFWSWIHGLVLPGRRFTYIIMNALLYATPSLRPIPDAQQVRDSLIVDGRSYWQAQSVVGRVLGGLQGVRAVCGWVGPCPPPVEDSVTGWVGIRARAVGFRLPGTTCQNDRSEGGHSTMFSPDSESYRAHGGDAQSAASWVTRMNDPNMWRAIEAPKSTAEHCEFKELHLTLPETSTVAESTQNSEYQASIVMGINGQFVTFMLYTTPTFIAAHVCIDGPHSVHVDDLCRLQNACTIADLKTLRHKPSDGVLVINAACEGGELAARAWCSENGQHAVVRRTNAACFVCAVRMASDAGLGVNCLIWS